jgi:hypothetical protein
MAIKIKKPLRISPCDGCANVKYFRFRSGCGNDCKVFLRHLKEVFRKKVSPCKDLRCGVPGITSRENKICQNCPLPQIYSDSLGGTEGRCPLGDRKREKMTRYKWDWETEYK